MLRTGLSPYGLTYYLGLQGAGTPRANPGAAGLEGFIALTQELGGRTLEIWDGWLEPMGEPELDALRVRLEGLDMVPVISSGLERANIESAIRWAVALNATTLRFALTPVLCGDRAAWGARWYELVAIVRSRLADWALRAAEHGLAIVIENHQDFTSHELVNLCHEAGPNVGIVFDTGNAFAVGEAPLDFARVIAPLVRHLHLKDYRVQPTGEGFRLVRCALGEGAVPFREIVDLLPSHQTGLTAVLEPGALEARHVRLLTPNWWRGYAPREAETLAACLLAAQRNALPADADFRTPWEREADGELADYEIDMIRRSAAGMRKIGLM